MLHNFLFITSYRSVKWIKRAFILLHPPKWKQEPGKELQMLSITWFYKAQNSNICTKCLKGEIRGPWSLGWKSTLGKGSTFRDKLHWRVSFCVLCLAPLLRQLGRYYIRHVREAEENEKVGKKYVYMQWNRERNPLKAGPGFCLSPLTQSVLAWPLSIQIHWTEQTIQLVQKDQNPWTEGIIFCSSG